MSTFVGDWTLYLQLHLFCLLSTLLEETVSLITCATSYFSCSWHFHRFKQGLLDSESVHFVTIGYMFVELNHALPDDKIFYF